MKQESLNIVNEQKSSTDPVECLGQTFENEEARRAHFTELLREKLKDPEFRNIEGFPIGTDEAILELSDPPYYTACPNPWLNDFVEYWESLKENTDEDYHREPFAADVSEGKNDPIYNAHSYHTKVPHKAIMRYILHYTNPGDIVFDGFCGTGMTGVAAQLCGNKKVVESLGYIVNGNGIIYEKEIAENGVENLKQFSRLGKRKAILNDLSPIATFISKNYNTVTNVEKFETEANCVLNEIENELGWMYQTLHSDGRVGKINCVIWSDVFSCPDCSGEVVYWTEAVDQELGKVSEQFNCPSCNSKIKKRSASKVTINFFDNVLNKVVKDTKQVPVLISYTIDNQRFTKKPDNQDLELIKKIDDLKVADNSPCERMMHASENTEKWGDRWRSGTASFTHVHHLYTKRNLKILSTINERVKNSNIKFILTAIANRSSKMNRIHLKNFFYGGGGWNAGYLKGAIYLPSIPIETSIFEQWKDRLKTITRALQSVNIDSNNVIATSSTININIQENSLDYIFIDPPFGANLNYSELSFSWESWLRIWTAQLSEIVESKYQNKTIDDYRDLMIKALERCYKALKHGKWITIEFSNTSASVWNNIQIALVKAGFIIANVSALSKKQGSFNAVTNPTSVKQDLVISAYKPSTQLKTILTRKNSKTCVWDFLNHHLNILQVVKFEGNTLLKIAERDPRILYDRMVSYFIQNNLEISIDSKSFQKELSIRYSERDGMIFLPNQLSEYDKHRIQSNVIKQLSIFVDDEASAIEWLRQELLVKPKTYSEIHPLFLNELSGWKKNELQLELMTLLEQNFIKYDGNGNVPNQIHSYLSTNFKDMRSLSKDEPALVAKAKDRWYVPDPSKAGDIEKLRLRALLREFDAYKEEKKKIKQPRAEALRAGFNSCWENQDLQTILDISAKIPPAVLQEDEKLLMFYDNALTLTSNDDDDWD
ncbi:DNA methyltransferase [Pseudoalteromonas sp. S1612]|uniref:DNA methyltransferase n=1 Tax=Pseudoalteromonas sp. S1612 TaxID=579507 RepID=UPI00110A66CB|nr:DNA methyltransferase [Pseudoalteromonas sp. S1612]TMP55062.1 DNA methylase [Pseudoalteromonas sp. S1612]